MFKKILYFNNIYLNVFCLVWSVEFWIVLKNYITRAFSILHLSGLL